MLKMTEDQFEFACAKIDEAVEGMDEEVPLFEEDEKPDRGNRCKLSRRAVALMTGMRASQEVPQEALAAMFAVDQSTVSRYLGFALPVFEEFLPTPEDYEAAIRNAKTVQELRRILPDMTIIPDGTLIEVRRPADAESRSARCSGKGKMFAHSLGIVTNTAGMTVSLYVPHPGSTHDLTALRLTPPKLGRWLKKMMGPNTPKAERMRVRVDKGYPGLEDLWPGADIIRLEKKPKGGMLARAQSRKNRELGAKRMPVEHAIGRIKPCGIMRGRHDGDLEQFMLEAAVAAGMPSMSLTWDERRKRPRLAA